MSLADTHQFAISLVGTIRSQFFVEGELDEARFREHAPVGHYAATCFAVASFRAYSITDEEELYDAGAQTLRQYLDLSDDERGHAEFNSFALLEAVEDAREGRYELPVSPETVSDQVGYSSSFDTRDGNNWLLLQALCRSKYASLFDDADEYRRAKRILDFAKRWCLDDGIVADEPRYRLTPLQTPLTYHAKSSMVFSRVADRLAEPELLSRTREQLRALSRLCLPSGECLYFGRSENTIFGYASAIDALSHLEAATDRTPRWCTDAKRSLVRYLIAEFDPDRGNCQPEPFSLDERRLDPYIFDTVYASYAAMLLLGVPAASSDRRDETRRTASASAYEHLPDAALLAARGEESAVGLATEGQIRPRRFGPDPRYAGLIPQTFVHGTEPVCPGIPVSVGEREGMPFLPVIRRDGARYVPAQWETTVRKERARIVIRGDGRYHEFSPSTSERTAGSDGTSLSDRLKRRIKASEAALRVAEAGYRSARRLLRTSRLDLVYENYATKPVDLPTRTRRSIHYLSDEDVLVVQTGTVLSEETVVRPSSVVVTDAYESNFEATYSCPVDVESERVKTHKREGYWHRPDECSHSSLVWSVIVLDPGERVRRSESTVEDDALVTRLDVGGYTEELRNPLSDGDSRE